MSNHEQPTPSHPKSDVRNTVGKDKQTPQGSARTTSAVDLEEFCEKHYEKLLPIMADKYEYERRKKEKLEEVKARLDFGEARKKSTKAQESAYSESRTMSPKRQRRSRIPRYSPSVFTRDLEAEDGVRPHTPIAVKKAQGIWKITLKAKIVKEDTGSLNHEGKQDIKQNLPIHSVTPVPENDMSLPHAILVIQMCIPSINLKIPNTDGQKITH
ncbi:hypothetical protein Tco_0970087 [Tanacetum coccineum]